MFETLSLTTELNIIYDGCYYSHIDFLYYLQCVIIRAGNLELTYIR